MREIWNDCDGGVLSTELLLLTSILVAGLASGLTSVRDAISSEFSDVANSVQSLNQSFMVTSAKGASAVTAGSQYMDQYDPSSDISTACIVMGESY